MIQAVDGRIGRFHIEYTFFGQIDAAAAARLDTLVRDRLPDLLEHALDAVLGGDPAVYVLRRIRVKLAINLEQADFTRLLHDLATQTIRAIVHYLSSTHAGEVVRFENQAKFVASFVAELMRGDAWLHWYFGAFAAYRHQPPAEAALAVLADNVDHLPAILAELHRRDRLDSLLRALGPQVASLWPILFGGASPEALSSLAETAILLLDSLDVWQQRPDASVLAAEYAAAPPDWNDPRSLAAAVLDMIQIARRHGWVRAVDLRGEDWDRALRAFDWLDTAWLRDRLARAAVPTVSPDYPARVTDVLTPRVHRLLDDLAHAPGFHIDPADTAEIAALRLLAALVAYRPDWAGDALVASLIPQILKLWDRIRRAPVPLHTLDDLMRGVDTVPGISPALVSASAPLLRRLLAAEAGVAPDDGTETTCAGLFLLLRVLLDTRLAALAQHLNLATGTPGPLLVALAYRWAGLDALDSGIDVFAGLDAGDDWRSAWGSVSEPDVFEADVMRVLVGQRVIDEGWTPDPSSLAALAFGRVGDPAIDAMLDRLAAALLLAWGRWLRGFEASTLPFLLNNFIRRRGWLRLDEHVLWITLERGPLDIVLEMSGYTSDVEHIPWLDGRRMQFRIREQA